MKKCQYKECTKDACKGLAEVLLAPVPDDPGSHYHGSIFCREHGELIYREYSEHQDICGTWGLKVLPEDDK